MLKRMSAYRFPIPICQAWNWYDVEDGTLARMPSPVPTALGLPGSEEEQPVVASGACSYLNPVQSGTVAAPQAAFDRLRGNSSAARITSVQCIDGPAWGDGSTSATERQEIHIDGQTITIIRPSDGDAAGKNLPTTAQLAEALRAVPANHRSHTSEIVVSPVAEPRSTPGRTIAADASRGKITFYPLAGAQSQNDFDNRVMHEAAHNYQEILWVNGATAVAAWGNAIRSDNRSPSPYATAGFGEDFCEFYVLFITSRGTACEGIGRQLYSHRWALMVEYQSR